MQRALAVTVVVLFGSVSPGARAQSGSGSGSADGTDEAQGRSQMREESLSDEQARSHFRVGQLLYSEGRFDDAGAEFEIAYRLSQRPALLYNAYVAYRDANNLERAIVVLDEYLRLVPESEDSRVLARRLESMRQTYESRMTEQSEIDAERRRLEEERARLASEAEAERARAEAAERTIARRSSPVPWVVGGAGLALLVGAGVSAIIANGNISDAEDECPDQICPRSTDLDEIRASLRRPAITTDVMVAVGGATLVTGVVLLLVRSSDDESAPNVAAGCTATGCGGTYTLRF